MDNDDDECGPVCCLCSIVFGVLLALGTTLSLRLDELILLVLGIVITSIVCFWTIFCCIDYWNSVQLPVIIISIRRPIPNTQPAIVNSYKMNRTDVVCTICMEEIKKKSVCKKVPKCGHEFHKKCIDKWLKESKTCPNCRLDV